MCRERRGKRYIIDPGIRTEEKVILLVKLDRRVDGSPSVNRLAQSICIGTFITEILQNSMNHKALVMYRNTQEAGKWYNTDRCELNMCCK